MYYQDEAVEADSLYSLGEDVVLGTFLSMKVMFSGNTENDMSDMAELSKERDDLKVLIKLFQKEIEDIKKAKS